MLLGDLHIKLKIIIDLRKQCDKNNRSMEIKFKKYQAYTFKHINCQQLYLFSASKLVDLFQNN